MKRAFTLAMMVLGAGCATLANGHPGLDYAPTAQSGPFRILVPGEIGASRPAPFAIEDSKAFFRDPAVLDLDGDRSTLSFAVYFAGNVEGEPQGMAPDRIVRLTGIDGRTLANDPPTDVLTPTLDWEGGTVGAPSVLSHAGEVRLYYAAQGGIGLARSSDGIAFEKEAEPVLVSGAAPWFSGFPRSPSVIELPDHSFRLFFEANTSRGPAIGEASSSDGTSFQMVGDGPALAAGSALDGGGAGSPDAVMQVSAEGRTILSVYYTAIASDGSHAVGLAARFIESGSDEAPLERSNSSMLTPNAALSIREPAVLRFATLTFLFATENASKTSSSPAVIAGVAPALSTLPPPFPR